MAQIVEGRFEHRNPLPRQNYFFPIEGSKIAIIVPFYNESWESLLKTLISLKKCEEKTPGYKFTFCLIQDGWKHASRSMKKNLKKMFPNAQCWKELKNKKQECVTYILQTVADEMCVPTRISSDTLELSLEMTLIIKKDNRKKHNSHEWFFSENGYCGAIEPEFCLATDCSTLFDPYCIQKLVLRMRQETKCSVCTGRQVVMTAEEQGCKDNWMEWWYRMAQCYDFDSSFSAFMGAFALFGFLPVIPGPCGLYRWSDMKGKPLEWYFEVVNKPAKDCGLVLSNLKIAEDRILSYSAVLHTLRETRMHIEPDAEFYFEAEVELDKFVKQRRRWINGTFAGYLYLAQNPSLIWKSKMSLFRKLGVFFLIFCQIEIYCVVMITPAIFLCALYSILFLLFPKSEYDSTMPTVLWLAYIAFFIVFMVAHSKRPYIGWMFYILMILSAFTVVFTLAGTFVFLINEWYQRSWFELFPILYSLAVMISPLLISLHRTKSFFRCIKSFIPFYLFLPTLVAWFGSYAVARFWDVTWGNRPAGEEVKEKNITTEAKEEEPLLLMEEAGGMERNNPEDEEDEESRIKEEEEEDKRVKEKVMNQSRAFAAFMLLVNLMFILVYAQQNHSDYFRLIAVCLIFFSSTTQILISLVYFSLNHLPNKLLFTWVAQFIGFILSHYPNHTYDDLNKNNNSIPSFSKKLCFGLTFIYFAINFGYHGLFQIIPYRLHFYKESLHSDYEWLSVGCHLLGFTSILVGWWGDRCKNQASQVLTFRMMTAAASFVFIVGTIAFICLRYLLVPSPETCYTLLVSQSLFQVLCLNIIASSSFVVFLQYTDSFSLLKFIAVKTIMIAFGNVIASGIGSIIYLVKDDILEIMINSICCLLLLLSVIAFYLSTMNPPDRYQQKNDPVDEVRNRRIAIVLVTYFFFVAALAPTQFSLGSFFSQMGLSSKASFRAITWSFNVQNILVLLCGLITLFFLNKYLKKISLFLAMTSFIQFLFLFPTIGTDPEASMLLLMLLGLCRTIPEVFASYFFAREVQKDLNRTGFWVASMNVALVSGQLFTHSILSSILQPFIAQHFIFGICTVFSILGVACLWRIQDDDEVYQ